jgi:twitching motility protein PilJ
MSFLDKIKAKVTKHDQAMLDDDGHDKSLLGGVMAMQPTLGHADSRLPEESRLPGMMGINFDSSIITEAAPSELNSEFALGDALPAARQDSELGAASGLPLIGHLPAGLQQRILGLMVGVGLLGLAAMSAFSVNSATKGAAQVGASGQALMQSQRLAKSVTQALVGSAQAFPEVQESADVLARNVHGLSDGSATLNIAPTSVLANLKGLLPLVDAAEKNAKVVMDQQQILTQVGQALRTINRQSSDLLEIAETVSSLKLQQESSPAELSAVGQLVMLTQRIGKSANEFLTMEG